MSQGGCAQVITEGRPREVASVGYGGGEIAGVWAGGGCRGGGVLL